MPKGKVKIRSNNSDPDLLGLINSRIRTAWLQGFTAGWKSSENDTRMTEEKLKKMIELDLGTNQTEKS